MPRSPQRWVLVRRGLVGAGFGIVAIGAHWTTLDGYFVSDDFEELLGASGDGPRITTETHPGRNLRPLNQWLHRQSVEWFDRDPVPQHWVSLAIHVVVALMVVVAAVGFARWLERPRAVDAPPLIQSDRLRWFALAAGGIFLVHPSHTEAVSWISARSDLLMGVGAVATVICWWWPHHRRVGWTLAACVGLVVALASKEPAVGIPILVATLEATRSLVVGGSWRSAMRSALTTWPLWLVLVPYGVTRQLVLGTTKSGSWIEEFFGESPALTVLRAGKLTARTVLPALPVAGWVVAALLLMGSCCGLALRWRQLGQRARSLVVLAFGTTLAVTLQYAPVARLGVSLHHSGGERFTYVPGVMASLLIAMIAVSMVPFRAARWVPAALIVTGAITLMPAQHRWARSAALSEDLVRSEVAMPRDEPVVVLNLADLMAGSLLGRNALGNDLEFVHGWRGPAPVDALATYDAGIPNNRTRVTVRGTVVRLELIERSARFLDLSGSGSSWKVAGANVRELGPRTIEVDFDAGIRRQRADGTWIWPTVWVADGRAYRRVAITLADLADRS